MIPFNDLNRLNKLIYKDIQKDLSKLISNSSFILGNEVLSFENDFQEYTNTKYALGVANGQMLWN